jgi:SSS family solute:Na+ symporter
LLLTGYAVVTQCFPGVVLGLFWKRARGTGVFIGMIAGVLTAVALMSTHLDPLFGLNAGFVALCINFLVTIAASLATPARAPAAAPELT